MYSDASDIGLIWFHKFRNNTNINSLLKPNDDKTQFIGMRTYFYPRDPDEEYTEEYTLYLGQFHIDPSDVEIYIGGYNITLKHTHYIIMAHDSARADTHEVGVEMYGLTFLDETSTTIDKLNIINSSDYDLSMYADSGIASRKFSIKIVRDEDDETINAYLGIYKGYSCILKVDNVFILSYDPIEKFLNFE